MNGNLKVMYSMDEDTSKKKKKKKSFKHLKVLRKALAGAYTGCIAYETEFSKKGKIQVTVGDMLDDISTVEQLEALLTQDVSNCELISEGIEKSLKETSPPIVFSKVMNGIQWCPDTLESLRESFCKLPPISVKMIPMHRYAYNDGLTYLMLYQESLKKDGFTAEDFFKSRRHYTSLEQQIKVLVLGYCLGLINIDDKADKLAKQGGDKNAIRGYNVATRILQKIRGI